MLKGFYFINTNWSNRRAHSIQISKTVESVNNYSDDLQLSLVMPAYSNIDLDELFEYYGVANKFEVILLKNFFFKKSTKVSFIFFTLRTCLFVLNKKIKKQVDFVYFRSEYFILLRYLVKILDIPFYYEIHRRGLSDKENKIKDSLAKSAKGLVTITQGLKDYYAKFNGNVVVAHDAVDLSRFNIAVSQQEARSKLSLPESKIIAMYVGSVQANKGVNIITNNAEKFPDILFCIVGKVNPSFSMRDGDNIKLVGQIDNALVPLYLMAADFLILPHPETVQSQSPMKLFEYMAVNKPIISSDLENVREVLAEDEKLFYRAGDDLDYQRAIQYFIENKEQIKINNSEEVKKYTWQARGEIIGSFLASKQ